MKRAKFILIILICSFLFYFISNKIYWNYFRLHPNREAEIAKCELVVEWFRKKQIAVTAIYGLNEILESKLNDNSIKYTRFITNFTIQYFKSRRFKPENILTTSQVEIESIFEEIKKKNIKCIIFQDKLTPNDNLEALKIFLKNGGFAYFRSNGRELHAFEFLDNVELNQVVLEYLKKGQLCIELYNPLKKPINKLSIKERVFAENYFIDDSNIDDFYKWRQMVVKEKNDFIFNKD